MLMRATAAPARTSPPTADRQLLEAGRRMAGARLVTGSVGNVSMRLDEARLRITATRRPWALLTAEDLVTLTVRDGRQLAGHGAPSKESAMHRAICRARPEVGAIVHTHSPYATAWSFLDEDLDPGLEETAYYDIGRVRTAPHAPPGSPRIAQQAVEALEGSRAALLARHGVVAVGESVEVAVSIAEAIEHQAQVAWLLRAMPPR
jgi:L-fuculose-phosphate aldolase